MILNIAESLLGNGWRREIMIVLGTVSKRVPVVEQEY